jgi:hypothetical protein
VALAGCASGPAPSPSPTAAFASADEAYAAAEKVYRAYNDALNAVDPTDPASFEPLFAVSSGSVLKADKENLSTMHAEGHTLEGKAVVLSFQGVKTSDQFRTVTAHACLDVSAVVVRDANGRSLVNPERPDIYALALTFREKNGGLRFDAAKREEGVSCAQ